MSIKNLYIKEIVIDNYKSLRDTKINLQFGLNIIIGKNGAGKSNLLQFIYSFINRNIFLGNSRITRNLNPKFTVIIEYLENERVIELSLAFQKNKNTEENLIPEFAFTHTITLNKKVDGKKTISNKSIIFNEKERRKSFLREEETIKELEILRLLRKTFIKFNFPSEISWVTKPNRITIDIDNDISFEDYFSELNLFAKLEGTIEYDFFQEQKPKKKLRDIEYLKKNLLSHISNYFTVIHINDYLNKYTPIKEIRLNPNINFYKAENNIIIENLMIDFLIDTDWVPWSYLSDGSKRLFYLITEILTANMGIILVEEPELGIHPHQLYKVLDFLKEQSKDKQILISTHSPISLDILEENELSRIIIAKYEKSSTQFLTLNKNQIKIAKRYMNEIGELSYYWLHSDLEND